MALTQYYTATTLDGFIADADNSLEWLFRVERGQDGDEGPDETWDAFIGAVGAMAMGSTTYEWVLDHEKLLERPDRWREFYGDRPAWVFTHRDLPVPEGLDIRLVRDEVRPVHETMRAVAAGRNVWLVGGGDLVGQFHDAGLLDQVIVSVAPVTLGSGAPLLPRRIEGLRLVDCVVDGQMVRLTYDVRREAG
jgi:dihydrofolate reductase